MGWLRRFSVSLGVVVSILATLAVASVGASGGLGGRFVLNEVNANASYFNPDDGSSTNISVDRQLFYFRPRGGGALQGPQLMTVLSVSYFIPNADPTQPPVVNQALSAIIPDGDFVIANDLGSASVNTVVDAGSCAAVIALNGVQPAKGVGGCGTGFTGQIAVHATWTGSGVVATQDDQGTARCGSFVATTHNTVKSQFSHNVTANITELPAFSGGAPFVFGSVANIESVNIVAGPGIISPACGGKG